MIVAARKLTVCVSKDSTLKHIVYQHQAVTFNQQKLVLGIHQVYHLLFTFSYSPF